MKTMDRARRNAEAPRAPSGFIGLAWIAIAAIPVFAVLAFVVGEVSLSVLGHPSGGDAPLWVSLIADLAAAVVALIPCVAAVVLGRRARGAHERNALAPIVIGALAAAGWIVLIVVTEIGNAL